MIRPGGVCFWTGGIERSLFDPFLFAQKKFAHLTNKACLNRYIGMYSMAKTTFEPTDQMIFQPFFEFLVLWTGCSAVRVGLNRYVGTRSSAKRMGLIVLVTNIVYKMVKLCPIRRKQEFESTGVFTVTISVANRNIASCFSRFFKNNKAIEKREENGANADRNHAFYRESRPRQIRLEFLD